MARLAGWESDIVGRITGLELAKSGADLAFTWNPDPGSAGGYHLHETDVKEDASSMRSERPDYDPFATVGPQATQPFIYENGASSGLSYYRILGVAPGGVTEGPN